MKATEIEAAFFALAEIGRLSKMLELVQNDENALAVLTVDRGAFRHNIKLDKITALELVSGALVNQRAILKALGVEEN